MANPRLDFDHPLHVFNGTIPTGEYQNQTHSLSYTAPKDVYLYGTITGDANTSPWLKIGATYVTRGSAYYAFPFNQPVLIPEGTEVVVSNGSAPFLHIYDALA